MARLENKHRGISENIIVKVTPVNIPTDAAGWEFGGILWKDKTVKKHGEDAYRYKADPYRKVMRVKYAATSLRRDPTSTKEIDTFLIDVPKHFFDADGNFSATPAYDASDILHVLWTGGLGLGSGWIDLNYQERGGNGGGTTVTTEVGCAKWS
jgi:hypothetical protein